MEGARGRSRPQARRSDRASEGTGRRAAARCRRELAAELKLVPGRRGRELEQRARPSGLEVREVGGAVVPGDVEAPVLDAVVEPRAAEHELPEPVDERLAVHERQALPVADEVAPELAARFLDQAVGGQLDEILGLLLVELIVVHEAEPVGGRRDALREVGRIEAEAETEELDHDVVAGRVVLDVHPEEDSPRARLTLVSLRAALLSGLVTAGLVLLTVWIFELPLERAAVLAPVLVVIAGVVGGLVVLWTKVGWESLQRREHPWRVVALAVGVFAVLVALSLLGLKLPRE